MEAFFTNSKSKYQLDKFSYSSILKLFGRAGKLVKMMEIVEEMKQKEIPIDVVTHNVLILALAQHKPEKMLDYLMYMKKQGVEPDVITYYSLIQGFLKMKQGAYVLKLWETMMKKNITPNREIFHNMMELYFGEENPERALEYLKEMEKWGIQPSERTYHVLINYYAKKNDIGKLTIFLEEVKQKELRLSMVCYATLVDAFGSQKQINVVDDLLNMIRKENYVKIPQVAVALVRAYTYNKRIITAVQLMKECILYYNLDMDWKFIGAFALNLRKEDVPEKLIPKWSQICKHLVRNERQGEESSYIKEKFRELMNGVLELNLLKTNNIHTEDGKLLP